MQADQFFFEDDGDIPNNRLPLLCYRAAFDARGHEGASWLEDQFSQHNWSNAWRNGVYSYHHYHSTTHEVLGVYEGRARLQMGGDQGQKLKVQAGDILVIPAGVSHKNLGSNGDFGVVGAYPDGFGYDIKTGKEGERPQADRNIAAVPIPKADPLLGKDDGLVEVWSDKG